MAKTVKVYSTPMCPYCTMTKDFLKEKNIPFESLDVSQDRDALIEMRDKTGQMGVPVIDIDGKIIVGFNREAISKELGI